MGLDTRVTAALQPASGKSYRYGAKITTPIICPPMAAACGGALAGATSAGGGFGIIGAGYYDAAKLAKEIQAAKDELQRQLHGQAGPGDATTDDAQSTLPIGVGFLVWKLTDMNQGRTPSSEDAPSTSEAHKMIDLMVQERVAAIWFSFGKRDEMEGWLAYTRAREQAAGIDVSSKDQRMKLLIGAGNLEEVRQAAEVYGADIISVTGGEAGGHGLGSSPPLYTLLADVKRELQDGDDDFPPVVGAGGLSDGASLAAILALGAEGGVFGTRYLLTPQAEYTDAQKRILLESRGVTLRTMAFDEARGTTGWPDGVDGRGIYNDTVVDYEAGLDAAQRRERYQQAVKEKDAKRIVTWSGTGVGNMHDIVDAAELTRRLTMETKQEIERLSKLVK